MKSAARGALVAMLLPFSTNAIADFSAVPSGQYGLDKTHGYITFTYSHLGFSTPHVSFDAFDVDLNLDNEEPTNSTVSVEIDATTINSRVDDFDGHLNGPDFFDTENFPDINFTSTSVASTGENSYDVTGDLTIMGKTKSVTLATTLNKAANHPMRNIPAIGFSGETKISRSHWGLDKHVPFVGDEITVYVTVELHKKQ